MQGERAYVMIHLNQYSETKQEHSSRVYTHMLTGEMSVPLQCVHSHLAAV